jgi:multiple sugar transport system ATP-binding protein
MVGIAIEHLTKVYPGGVTALDDLTLTVGDGQFFALLGPSGCGKTTLLRTIAGLETATSGSVRIGERDVTRLPPGDRDVAMVFQDYALFPHMSVTDNIAYPLRIRKVSRQDREAKATETAASLGLEHLMARRPAELSGGQQQRVALARAMACQPSAFLFDEPLSNLDSRLRLEARTFLKRLQRELAVTTIFVTHDQAEALAMADQIAVMEAGQIRQFGTPTEIFHRPANTFVANFIGSTPMNMVPGRLASHGVSFAGVTVPWRPVAGAAPASEAAQAVEGSRQDVLVGFRPEYTHLETDGPAATGEVEIVENLGASMLVSIMVGEQRLQAVVPEGTEPAVGQCVRVGPDPRRVLVYDTDGDLLL